MRARNKHMIQHAKDIQRDGSNTVYSIVQIIRYDLGLIEVSRSFTNTLVAYYSQFFLHLCFTR